jgi:short-subunit dehydrogenase
MIQNVPAQLNGARVLLTGATGGLGIAMARALHARGAHVVATGRRAAQLESLAGELDGRIEPIVADLDSADDVRALAERAGRIDVFVSSAGIPATGRFGAFRSEQVDRALDVNLRAPLQLLRELLPPMVERGSGHAVLVASMAGKVATSYGTVYNATKFGLRGFGLGLNDELHGTGVGVTVVNPGFIRDAGMFADANVKLPPGVGTKTPGDVADAVVKGIETGRGDIDVAPLMFRVGGRLYSMAPALVAGIQRTFGGQRIGKAMAEGQVDKR